MIRLPWPPGMKSSTSLWTTNAVTSPRAVYTSPRNTDCTSHPCAPRQWCRTHGNQWGGRCGVELRAGVEENHRALHPDSLEFGTSQPNQPAGRVRHPELVFSGLRDHHVVGARPWRRRARCRGGSHPSEIRNLPVWNPAWVLFPASHSGFERFSTFSVARFGQDLDKKNP